jgi:ACR3 family arsenite efflux pump ArsB
MDSVYSVDTLKNKNGTRIAIEFFGLFFLFTGAYLLLIEPILLSTFETIYVEPGLDYSRTNLPDTASELTHLLSVSALCGLYLYVRLYFTERGQQFVKEFKQARQNRN